MTALAGTGTTTLFSCQSNVSDHSRPLGASSVMEMRLPFSSRKKSKASVPEAPRRPRPFAQARSSRASNPVTGNASGIVTRELAFVSSRRCARPVAGERAPGAVFRRPAGRVGVSQLETGVLDQVGRFRAARGMSSMVKPSTSRTPVAPSRPNGHDRVQRSGRDGDPLDDPAPTAVIRELARRPGTHRASAELAELLAEEVDHQARLLAHPLAGLDLVDADPEAEDDRLVFLAVDAEGPAQSGEAARSCRSRTG